MPSQLSPQDGSSPVDAAVKDEDEELAALGGKTRLVSRKSPTYSTPSPHSSSQQSMSPVEQSTQLYMSPETPPAALEAASPVLPESAQWNGGYMPAADVYGYPYPQHELSEWQQQPQVPSQPHHQQQPHHPHAHAHQNQPQHMHGHMQGLSVDMGQVQYGGYGQVAHAPQIPTHHHPHTQYVPHVHSPVQMNHLHHSDPTTSWNYLFEQINQV